MSEINKYLVTGLMALQMVTVMGQTNADPSNALVWAKNIETNVTGYTVGVFDLQTINLRTSWSTPTNWMALTPAMFPREGLWDLKVNAFTAVNSTSEWSVPLTVNWSHFVPMPPPVIVSNMPPSLTVLWGSVAQFGIVATGEQLRYQWRFNYGALVAGTNATYVIPVAQGTHQGTYDVVVSNPSGSVTSSAVYLTIRPNKPTGLTLTLIPQTP